MRTRNREINIFNLSMLDVISGAMAAFLILVVVLMPYYRKSHIDYQAMIDALRTQLVAAVQRAESTAEALRTAEAQATAAQAAAQAAQAQAEATQAQAEAAQAQAEAARRDAAAQRQRAESLARELAKTFLVLYIRWGTGDDVDLHVVDPSGAEFSWNRRTHPGRRGQLSEDNVNGPGNEVWEIRDAPPGDYALSVVLFETKDPRKPVLVEGRLFHRDDSSPLPAVSLTRQGERLPLGRVRVAPDGSAMLQ